MTAAGKALLLASVLLLPARPRLDAAPGETPAPQGRALVPRGRWHHELAGPPRVRWSILFRRSDAFDETRLLVETPGGRWVLVSTQPADRAWTREEVESPSLAERVSRVLSHGPPDGVPACARVRPPDACVVLEGVRGRLAAPLSGFSGEAAESLRKRAAGLVSPGFLADLKGLSAALPIEDLAFYAEDFLALLDPSLARRPGTAAPGAPRLPGCVFDATFGYPCTADERRREEWLFRRTPVPAPR